MNRQTATEKLHGLDPAETVPVPLLDIARENGPLLEEIQSRIAGVCQSGQFVLGPECKQLEAAVASLSGTEFGIACASGSEALLLSLMAIGVEPGDEVIVPSFTFFATASAVWRLGATPVFADVDPRTFNVDPASVEASVTPRTAAIIPVHLFGQCANMDSLCRIGQKHGLAIVEDAAQAVAARHNNRPAGSMGRVGCFSFYPTKNLGGFGDGGMLTTNDAELADRLELLRGHGMRPRYYHHVVGINGRLDSIQAAALNVKLKHLPDWTAARQCNAARYRDMFAGCGLDEAVVLPPTDDGCFHVWNQFTIRVPDGRRDALRQHLAERKIGTEIYYPVALHQQACFQNLEVTEGSLPETERAIEEVLCLPIFPSLTEREQESVVAGIADFFGLTPCRPHVPMN